MDDKLLLGNMSIPFLSASLPIAWHDFVWLAHFCCAGECGLHIISVPQIARFMGPTWGPPESCRPQVGPMLVPWTCYQVCRWMMHHVHMTLQCFKQRSTVYPKKYAHGFCFAVLCCGYTLTDFPISIRLTSLALWQSNDCPSASKATLMNMDKYFMWIHYERLHNHDKAKHNKTVCIFLGIYCNLLKHGKTYKRQ